MTPTVWDHALAAALGVGLPLLGLAQRNGGGAAADDAPLTRGEKLVFYRLNALLLAALTAVAVLVWRAPGRTLAELGFAWPRDGLGVAAALAVLLVALHALDAWSEIATPERTARTRARWRRDTPFMPSDGRELGHAMVLIAAAAVGEEVLYRGFLVTYLRALLGGSTAATAAAVALPALAFAVCHAYQRRAAVVKIAVLSVGLGAIFVATGSLWIGVAVHLEIDVVAAWLGVRLQQREPGRPEG